MTLRPRDVGKAIRRAMAWRERSARRYEDRLRAEEVSPVRRIPPNRKRKARLRAEQFGTDGKYEWILSMPCYVTGTRPVDPAHVLGTRAAGHGPEGLCPLSREVHRAFDGSMTDERFARRFGRSRAEIRQHARELHERWKARGE